MKNMYEKHPIISVVIVSAACSFFNLFIVPIAASFGCSADTATLLSDTISVLATCAFSIPIMIRAIKLELKKSPRNNILIGLYGFIFFNFAAAGIMQIAALL